MTFTAFLLILISVFLHVSWNLLSKATRPSAAFYIILSIDAAVITVPFLFLARVSWGALGIGFWTFLLLSIIANVFYYSGLFSAYKHGDISLVYPLARALPVLMTALVTLLFGIGKAPSLTALLGMAIVFFGCIIMPLKRWSDFHPRNYITPALGSILIAACGTTCYTIFDSISIPVMNQASKGNVLSVSGAYMVLLEAGIAAGLSVHLIFRKEERYNFKILLKSWSPHISGLFTAAAYMLVLIAMPMVTNVSFVQVFRQIGLPMSVLAGVFLLHENCSFPRIIGMIAVVSGLIITVL